MKKKYNLISFKDHRTGAEKTPILSYVENDIEYNVEDLDFDPFVEFIAEYLQTYGITDYVLRTVLSTSEFWREKKLAEYVFGGRKKDG